MTAVIADVSMSLDGFSAGANDGPANPMGDGGMALHEWFFAPANALDADVIRTYQARIGAVILGKRMFENGLRVWDGGNPWGVPAFVLAHEHRKPLSRNGDTLFTFVDEGIESALDRATAAAGGKDVAIAGGAATIQQVIAVGRLDEIQVHIVPLLLGSGVKLFEQGGVGSGGIQPVEVVASPGVTHIRYRIAR